MNATTRCPGCEAELTLPLLPAGQSVQCPRCGRIFASEPPPRRVAAPLPAVKSADAEEMADQDLFRLPRPAQVLELRGEWIGYVSMALIGVTSCLFVVLALAEFRFLELRRGEPLAENVAQALFFTGWPALMTFIGWLCLATGNARLLRVQGLTLSSGFEIVALMCCPVVNLILLYHNLQQLWRACDPKCIDNADDWHTAPKSMLIRIWGVNVCCPFLMIIAVSLLEARAQLGGVQGDWIALPVCINVIIGATLLIPIMYDIMRRQRARFIRLYEDPD